MRHPFIPALCGLLLAGLAQADPLAGQRLHDAHCMACHTQGFDDNGNGIYTRDDRRVSSHDALQRQVNFCQNNLGLAWFEEEVESVVSYLNQQFYHFN